MAQDAVTQNSGTPASATHSAPSQAAGAQSIGRPQRHYGKIAAMTGGAIAVIAIIWLDIATGLWQNVVILSGLAAGLVSFLLSTIFLRSITARETARRWAPLNRLAITEFLHAIADAERSEVAHGIVVPRELPRFDFDHQRSITDDELRTLREAAAKERRALSHALSRWATFLTSTGDNEEILQHVARIAFQLDQVRDTALEYEEKTSEATRQDLEAAVGTCNTHFSLLVDQLKLQLEADNALEIEKRHRA